MARIFEVPKESILQQYLRFQKNLYYSNNARIQFSNSKYFKPQLLF